jgi:hypothetical protein
MIAELSGGERLSRMQTPCYDGRRRRGTRRPRTDFSPRRLKNVMKIHAGVLAVCLFVAAPAYAQQAAWTEKGFVTVNGGFQAGSHDLSATTNPMIYGEAAAINSSQKIKGGPFFDIGAGYKFMKTIAFSVSYTFMTSKSDASVNGTIPDPVFYDQQRPFSSTLSGAKHTENVVSFDAAWLHPITEKVQITASAGPSVFMVKQDLIGAPTVTENPFAVSTPATKASKTTVGLNLGVDLTYLIGTNWGVGGLARYTWGSVTLPGAPKKLTVGGFQIGGGARLLF